MKRNTNCADTAVVLVGHGVPATDYPPMRVGLLMILKFAGKMVERIGFLRAWRDTLETEVRTWPRTTDNDPYKAAVDDLAAKLSTRLGYRVIAAYNEFCAPTVAEAIDQLIAEGACRVIIVPTMLMRGSKHAEKEIYEDVVQASKRHPTIDIRYAWPFEPERLISLFADQIITHVEKRPSHEESELTL